ncbi:MoaD/ThiS family protein [Phosphitispora fastidiosa]|uniref:MoaD/ThiS family protein n=1 Tax=Phosphitispora fastidiosa TaxID=2837202 RepID=UPI001E38998D|nr:molybdopterin converting factor small subunit [Phosphitispora fastidiosa]
MELEIRLFTGLKCNNQELPCFGKQEFYLDAPDEITVRELHGILGLDRKTSLISLINGLSRPDEWVLKNKDRVGIFPPVGGG